jgi:hypothetical protein
MILINMKKKIILSIIFIGMAISVFGQQKITWNKWSWILGEWIGEGAGQPGQGAGTFSFGLELEKNILVRKSHSEYPASENKPKVIHDDLMIVYPDPSGSVTRAIYFDNEGHTINYTVEYSEKSIVMTSDKIPNGPIFRLTYTLLENQIVDTKFEMSQDGVKYMVYVEGKSRKNN